MAHTRCTNVGPDLHAAGHEGVDEEEAGHPEHGWLCRVDPLLEEVQPEREGPPSEYTEATHASLALAPQGCALHAEHASVGAPDTPLGTRNSAEWSVPRRARLADPGPGWLILVVSTPQPVECSEARSL